MEKINEEMAFLELQMIKEDIDNQKEIYGPSLCKADITSIDVDINHFEERKIVRQWLIDNGYLMGSELDANGSFLIDPKTYSPITSKGMEYYKELSKKYDKEYWAERARKKLSETIGEGYENE